LAGRAVSSARTPWAWGYWSYYNPFATGPVVVYNTTIDYSQPLLLAQPVEQPAPVAGEPTPEELAVQLLDAAVEAFRQGDHEAALAQVDRAVAWLPSDAVLHEFRGQTLFALQRYKEAAVPLHAVLSVGPGWDWTTLSSLYLDIDVYTAQLRALEHFVKNNPQSAEARFVLAYQYLTAGHTEAAATQLEAVVQSNPRDQVSAQLLHALTTPAAAEQPPSQPTAPAMPIDAAGLAGNWKAIRPHEATISLDLAKDSTFTWRLMQNDKPKEFSGTYLVADDLLILRQGNQAAMTAQITWLAADRFNFRLGDNDSSDPGLTFTR